MRKMIGIVMMVAGGILLAGGYFVYGNKEEKLAKEEIEGQIQAVMADGVFTEREKAHITQLAGKHNLKKEKLFEEINERLTANENEAETEIIDQKKKKGDDFEKYIVKKFKHKKNQKYFTIKQWAGDKYVDGIYSEKTQQPDLIVEYHYKGFKQLIAIECKWRSQARNNNLKISYDDQLNRYKEFEKKEKTDVYIALGVGGKASAPDNLYIIPLKELTKPSISLKQLEQYEKSVDSYFFLNMHTVILETRPFL